MQLTARLSQILPVQTGQGKNGEWKKQNIIMETDSQYPKKICVTLWGDRTNDPNLVIGSVLKIDLDLESREYNGNWYNDIKGWRIEPANGQEASNSKMEGAPISPPDEFDNMTADDLPF